MGSHPGPLEAVRVLICGAPYGSLAAATNLIELSAGRPHKLPDFSEGLTGHEVLVEITLIDERDGFYHLIGSPLALAETQYVHRAWQRFDEIKALQQRNIRFVHGAVDNVDCEAKIAIIQPNGGQSPIIENYDYLVAATGLRRVWPTVPQALDKQKYMVEAQGHIDKVQRADSGVVVIGGGRCVEVITGKRVLETIPCARRDPIKTTIKLSDGSEICAGHVISAISKPTSTASYLPQHALSSDSLVQTTENLHLKSLRSSEYHLAVGDILDVPGIKRCGAAMHTGNIAAHNIYKRILHDRGHSEGSPVYRSYPKDSPSIILAIGKQAIGYSADYWQDRGSVEQGEELMKLFFEDDPGFGICWRHLGLGDKAPPAEISESS